MSKKLVYSDKDFIRIDVPSGSSNFYKIYENKSDDDVEVGLDFHTNISGGTINSTLQFYIADIGVDTGSMFGPYSITRIRQDIITKSSSAPVGSYGRIYYDIGAIRDYKIIVPSGKKLVVALITSTAKDHYYRARAYRLN